MGMMNHYYDSITGWFTFPRFYKDMVSRFQSGSKFIELGTYCGKSFSYLMVEMENQKKQFDVTAIDSFTFGEEGTGKNILDVFRINMKPFEGRYNVIKDCSWEAGECFEDGSIDFLFIDADHRYESVLKDITAWVPKMKPGGIISGHDYQPEHPGVIQAVDEIFGEKVQKEYGDEWIWYVNID